MLRLRIAIALLTVGAIGTIPMVALRADAAFPGTNGKIAFRRDTAGPCPGASSPCSHIFVMNPDGSGQTDLEPNSPDIGNTFPAWNRDSTKLAFTDDTGLAVMNADGSGRTHIHDGAAVHASWSPPNLNKIVFDNNSGDIHTINPDGSGDTDLTGNAAANNGVTDIGPAWSPDGSLIAFGSEDRSTGAGIYVMKPDGTAATKIAAATWVGTEIGDVTLDWSPDSSKLVYADPSDNNGGGGIDIVNRDGSSRTHLLDTKIDPPAPSPHWSPDGTRISFRQNGATAVDVWVMGADGINPTDITNYPDQIGAEWPAWGSSGASGTPSTATSTTTTTSTTPRPAAPASRPTPTPAPTATPPASSKPAVATPLKGTLPFTG